MAKEVIKPKQIITDRQNNIIFEYQLKRYQVPNVRLIYSSYDWQKLDLNPIQPPDMQVTEDRNLWVYPPYFDLVETTGATFQNFRQHYMDFSARRNKPERVHLTGHKRAEVDPYFHFEFMNVDQEMISEAGSHLWSHFGLITGHYPSQPLIRTEVCEQINPLLISAGVDYQEKVEARMQNWHGPIEVTCEVRQLRDDDRLIVFEQKITFPETDIEILRNGERLAMMKIEKVVPKSYL